MNNDLNKDNPDRLDELYFDREGIRFRPTIAYLNDLAEMMEFAEGGLSPERRGQAETDLFLHHIYRCLDYSRR